MNQFNYTMLCAVDNEKIYQVDQYGRKEIGVLMKHYTDTMELLKKFQEKSEQYKKMLEDEDAPEDKVKRYIKAMKSY